MSDESTNQGIPEPEGHSEIIDTEYEIGQDNIETQIELCPKVGDGLR
jgi:BCCT family betaine/carnitine transporter